MAERGPSPAVIVAGPTASGKSALAMALAAEFNGVVINADSIQIYQELRILTARPSLADEARVPHRLYGVLPMREVCSAARWRDRAGPGRWIRRNRGTCRCRRTHTLGPEEAHPAPDPEVTSVTSYLLIESRDPFEANGVARDYGLARSLAEAGNDVTLFLVQNGVLPTRAGARSDDLAGVAGSSVEVLADEFSLRERGIAGGSLVSGVSPASLDVVVDGLAAGHKAIWL